MNVRRLFAAALATAIVAGTVVAAPAAVRRWESRFPHEKHARVFPLCTTCHAGVLDSSRSVWPEPARCASCHDGVVEKQVQWEPRIGPRPGNRRFTHQMHDRAATRKNPGDSALITNCSSCHNVTGTHRMNVENAVVEQCLSCHKVSGHHMDVASSECAKCHVRLTEAPGLTREDISRFPEPRSHQAPDFLLGGHGKLAGVPGLSSGRQAISASCATCHARNFCMTCHVNASESPVVSALDLDDRSPVYAGAQPIPPSHRKAGFLRVHGRHAQQTNAACSTCHTRESCATCHVGVLPVVAAALPTSGPGRARGVQLTRKPPSNHTVEFRERAHGPEAGARPRSCETCHTRATCLSCHRPEGARESSFHPRGFLTRHPSAAYAREASCGDCHNQAQFCQSCHQQSGLIATSRIGLKGYHDVFRGFSLGHGQAARQSLESCASCHAERDCTACHSAVGGGFRFSPHGPGFNAQRARSKNPTMCVACHGRVIPGGN